MAQIIPLKAVPNQAFVTPVGLQNCGLIIRQLGDRLYMDVYLNEEPVILSVICEVDNRIIRNLYLGFSGDFFFIDTEVDADSISEDPVYTGLGDRWQLVYVEASELPEGVG